MGQIISSIQKHLLSRFFNTCSSSSRQNEQIPPEDLEDQNGHYTLRDTTPEASDASDNVDKDSTFELHQDAVTTCIDIVEENIQQDSVSRVLNVKNLEENRQIVGSVPVDLQNQNGNYTLPVATPVASDPSNHHDTDSRFSLHQNVDIATCIDIVEDNEQLQEQVFVSSFEEKGKIAGSVPERWIRHYCSSQRILIVGDGDFSFSACLARAFGSATNMVATSLDSRVMLQYKYTGAIANLEELKGLGCTIIHGVDCNTMNQHYTLRLNSFDRIVYNFPHSGFFAESTPRVIELHKRVVRGFLRNAIEMLRENGEVHITHKTSHPFSEWGIEKLGNEVGLVLYDEVPFHIWVYPGYKNKFGAGKRCNESFPVGACSTYKFKI